MGLAQEICFRLARRMIRNRKPGDRGENPATLTREAYQKWRDGELRQQFTQNFELADVAGADVLDFGCGEGDLSFLVASLGAASVRGIDLAPDQIETARRRAATFCAPVVPSFACGTRSDAIDLPEESVDVILCFDVLEHVMDYPKVTEEWLRILRPGGSVLIWWMPWWHPYGPHIESLVPIPWAHALFSDRTLLAVCARIYDLPEFQPRLWDLDDTGRKKPNKWKSMTTLPEVNRLTMRRFEATCRETGLLIERRQLKGFRGRLARWTHVGLHVPLLREFLTQSVTYKLRKPVPADIAQPQASAKPVPSTATSRKSGSTSVGQR